VSEPDPIHGHSPARQAVRGFGVVVAPSVIASAAGAAGIAATTRSLMHRRAPGRLAAAATLMTAAYVGAARPRMRRWGARPDETGVVHAVEIDAPPEQVWPWLAQIGQDRAGFYSYEWLENLAGCRLRNAVSVHDEWQHRDVGEKLLLHPSTGLNVLRFEPGRLLELEGWGTFTVEPLGARRSRLVARAAPVRGLRALMYALTIELQHFVMEREMLLGIKRRAESRRFPGDELVPEPRWSVTRSTHIAAPPAAVWPWLVQMGFPGKRAGWYAPYWFDRVLWRTRERSADEIVPELQHLAVGDRVPDSVDGSAYFTVAGIDPGHALILRSHTHVMPAYRRLDLSWAFVLDREAEGSRLTIRARADYEPAWPGPLTALFARLVLTPGDAIEAGGMLRGIRRRAESASVGSQPGARISSAEGGRSTPSRSAQRRAVAGVGVGSRRRASTTARHGP
jgi:hypothetical protein